MRTKIIKIHKGLWIAEEGVNAAQTVLQPVWEKPPEQCIFQKIEWGRVYGSDEPYDGAGCWIYQQRSKIDKVQRSKLTESHSAVDGEPEQA